MTDVWDQFQQAVQAEDWSAAVSAALDGLSAWDDEIRLVQLLDTLQDAQVVEAFCRQAAEADDVDELVRLRASLGDGGALASVLEQFSRGPQAQRLRMCVHCALAACHAGRSRSEEAREALWAAAGAVVGDAMPDQPTQEDVRALLEGPDGLALVRRICEEIHGCLGDKSYVAAQVYHLTSEFMVAPHDPAAAMRLTGLLVGDEGGLDERGQVCWVECTRAEGFREIVPHVTANPPLGDDYLGGLVTALDYLRSLRDSNNTGPLLNKDTDLCLGLQSKYEDHAIGGVDGRSMTALVAALGENMLREGPPVDLSCSVSADLVCENGEWRLARVKGLREKVFAAFQAGLRSLVVCEQDEKAARTAAADACALRQKEHEAGRATPPAGALHIIPCRTVDQARTILTREPQALLAYLDAVRERMVQLIPTVFIPDRWRDSFFERLYQPLQVRFNEKRMVEQPPGPDGERQPPREESVEVRQSWDEYREEKLRAGTRRFEIEADGGHGKSTLLQFMTWKLATESAQAIREYRVAARDVRVPFFFRCDGLEDAGVLLEASMMCRIQEICHLDGQGQTLLRDLLTSERAVICWDAMDETMASKALAKRIASFAGSYPGPEIYLTCRSREFPPINWPATPGSTRIELALFDAETVGAFALAWAEMLQEQENAP